MKMTRLFSVLGVVAAMSLALASGCDGDDSVGGEACALSSDCDGNAVCVSSAGQAACTLTCDVNANECGGSASCNGVGALSVNICQDDPDPMAPPKPEEEPKIPCNTDAECDALQAGAVCVQFKNTKDCTILCGGESDCSVPTVGGITVDFLTCLPDEADTSRNACVPDEKCFANPLDCITGPGL